MSKATTALRDMIVSEIVQGGGTVLECATGGKHPFVRFTIAGVDRKIVYPSTPGDQGRILNNTRRDVRRTIREAKELKR